MFDPDEAPPPALDDAAYERLQSTLAARGPAAAIDELVADLRTAEDFQGLFYALLMKKRVELGVSPFPTGPATELPTHTHEPYENAIREAGRHVGALLLERKEYSKAWAFFRMLGEPEPMREALEQFTPGPDDDVYPIIEIAWQNGLLPKKGFDLVLDRHGICSAITMVSGSDLSTNTDLRDYCITKLAKALHDQLAERDDLATRRSGPGAVRGRRVPHRHVAPVERGADEHAPAARRGHQLRPRTLRLRPQALPEPPGHQRRALRRELRRLPRLLERDRR
jgi:hypothetical protein